MITTNTLLRMAEKAAVNLGHDPILYQYNPHHFTTVFSHGRATIGAVGLMVGVEQDAEFEIEKDSAGNYSEKDMLLIAAAFHDVGKYGTKSINEKTGYDSFIGHEKVSADVFREQGKEFFPDASDYTIEYIAQLIEYHGKDFSKQGKLVSFLDDHKQFKNFEANLLKLKAADIIGQRWFQRPEKLQNLFDFGNRLVAAAESVQMDSNRLQSLKESNEYLTKLASLKDTRVIFYPSYESVQESKDLISVGIETEYGKDVAFGQDISLIHHGDYASNPAPCNTYVNYPLLYTKRYFSSENLPKESGVIAISHVDLDTLGGIFGVWDMRQDDPEFWHAAEYIDINGPQHIKELPKEIQDKFNAYYCWNQEHRAGRPNEPIDVTEDIKERYNILSIILDKNHPEHQFYIDKGRDWEEENLRRADDKLVMETDRVRAFITDGVPTIASYYSRKQDASVPATITLNTARKSITIGLFDGGESVSAKDIVQELWGDKAGGRDGIAGSPRDWDISEEELEQEFWKAVETVEREIEIAEQDNGIDLAD